MIEVKGLIKQYGNIRALDNLSFRVERGSVFGLLGPNGAGKTTTIKVLTTLSKPDTGHCLIAGYDVVQHPVKVKRLIGVMPQENNLDRELTAYENLLIYSMLHGVPDREAKIRSCLELARSSTSNRRDLHPQLPVLSCVYKYQRWGSFLNADSVQRHRLMEQWLLS